MGPRRYASSFYYSRYGASLIEAITLDCPLLIGHSSLYGNLLNGHYVPLLDMLI